MQTDGRAAANGGFIGERSELGEARQSAREAVAPRARPRPATAGAARGRARGPESGVRTPVCKFFIYGFRFERTLPGPKPERHDTRGANMHAQAGARITLIDGYHKQVASRKSRAPLRSSSTPVRPRDALEGTPHVNVSPVLSEATYAVLYV